MSITNDGLEEKNTATRVVMSKLYSSKICGFKELPAVFGKLPYFLFTCNFPIGGLRIVQLDVIQEDKIVAACYRLDRPDSIPKLSRLVAAPPITTSAVRVFKLKFNPLSAKRAVEHL